MRSQINAERAYLEAKEYTPNDHEFLASLAYQAMLEEEVDSIHRRYYYNAYKFHRRVARLRNR